MIPISLIFTNFHQFSPIITNFQKIFGKFSENLNGLNKMIPKIYICWGIVADTNFQKIMKNVWNFLDKFHQFCGIILMGSTRRFQKYIYVWVKYAVIIICYFLLETRFSLLKTRFSYSELAFLTRNLLLLLETRFSYSKLAFATWNSLFLL